MRHALCPFRGAIVTVVGAVGADIVGFAVVWNRCYSAGYHVNKLDNVLTVPRNDFDQAWLETQHLLPTQGGQVLAYEHPVLAVEVRSKPW